MLTPHGRRDLETLPTKSDSAVTQPQRPDLSASRLVAQVVDGQHAARRLVDAERPVFGRQVDRHQRRVPVVGNEDALLAV